MALLYETGCGMEKMVIELTSTASIAVTVFGIIYCVTQTKHFFVGRNFAAFLAAVTANNIPDAFARIFEKVPDAYTKLAELVLWSPSSLFLAPLFWMYVFALTSPSPVRGARFFRHLILPVLAVVVGAIIWVSSPEIYAALFSDAPPMLSAWATTLFLAFSFLQLAVYPQLAVYLFFIIRRMSKYRIELRDYYSSTEKHELRWIYVIGGLSGAFWLATTLLLFLTFDPDQTDTSSVLISVASCVGLALVMAITLWGLRQRPPLATESEIEHQPMTSTSRSQQQPSEKYEKSALNAEASTRIARKLRSAMETDRLHRDPNLSLWALARHIGASPNYVSQTLNEVIGESFFDFVNGYRVTEAITRLSQTNDTVLAITFDVGFNARSSFYNAFKRVTGQTPTNYRKNMSSREGMDDRAGQFQES